PRHKEFAVASDGSTSVAAASRRCGRRTACYPAPSVAARRAGANDPVDTHVRRALRRGGAGESASAAVLVSDGASRRSWIRFRSPDVVVRTDAGGSHRCLSVRPDDAPPRFRSALRWTRPVVGPDGVQRFHLVRGRLREVAVSGDGRPFRRRYAWLVPRAAGHGLTMDITFIGHQSFMVHHGATRILVDPLLEREFGLSQTPRLEVFPSRTVDLKAMPCP